MVELPETSRKALATRVEAVRRRRRGPLVAVVTFGIIATPLAAEQERFTFGLAAVSDPYLGQREDLGFAETYETWIESAGAWGAVDYTFHLSVAGGHDEDPEFRLDGSQLALRGELWSVALGAKERNWSFSPNTSLIWSKNARPVPALWFERAEAPSEYRWLSWLGNWSSEIVFGLLDGEEPDPYVSLFGARLVVNPWPGLDLEFVRTAQWGGEGRPDGLDAFWNILIGNTNQGREDNTDPANQLAGVGISYVLPEQIAPLRFYVQAIGEDEASGIPSCEMFLAGAEWTGAIGSVPTTVVVEGLDTIIDVTKGGFCGPNTAYQGQYSRGYSLYGAVIGASLDTAGESIGIDVSHEFGEHTVGWGVTQVLINDTSLSTHRLSSERLVGEIGYVSYERDFGQARLRAGISYQGFDLDNADISEGLRASVGYEFTF